MLDKNRSVVAQYRTAAIMGGEVIENSYVLKRVDDGNGNSAVVKATGAADENIVGMANPAPIAATTRPVVGVEAVAAATVALAHIPVAKPSVHNVTKGAAVDAAAVSFTGAEMSLDLANASVDADDEIVISYRRSVTLSELSKEGLPMDFANSITGADGSVEFVTGNSTVYVDFFDTTDAFAIGADVFVSAEGIPTAKSGTAKLGKVDKVPTSEDPTLGIAFILNF